jgi:hypothetical protein
VRPIYKSIPACAAAMVCLAASSEAQTPQWGPKSADCSFNPTRQPFIPGQKLTQQMTVKNDGGSCWSDGYAQSGPSLFLTARDISVTEQPKHGQVTIGDVENHRIRVAYKPAAGYAGPDTFTIHYGVINTDKSLQVVVSK